MIKKIKSIYADKDKKRLLSNFTSLGILQLANYLLPLLTLPYLVITLGLEKFGLLAFVTAIVSYFNIIVDYGFNLTATRDIAVNRDNHLEVERIFSSVMIIKILLLVFSFLLLSIIIFSFEKFSVNWLVYYLTFGTVIGYALFPIWLFQGLEKMKYITILNVLAKVIFAISIFIFVKSESDYMLVPILTSLGFIISGLLAQVIIKKQLHISFRPQNTEFIIQYLKSGWHVFLSKIAISSYTTTTIVILGLMTNNTYVSYFSIAEKLITVVKQFVTIINQVLFPYINRLHKVSYFKATIVLRKIFIFMIAILIILNSILFFNTAILISLLFDNHYSDTIVIFKIFLIIHLVMYISQIIGDQILLPLNHKSLYSKSVLIPAFFHLCYSIILIYYYSAIGAAIAVVVTESFIAIYRITGFYYLDKKKFRQFTKGVNE